MQLIGSCGMRLKKWNRTSFGEVQQCLEMVERALTLAQERNSNVFNNEEVK